MTRELDEALNEFETVLASETGAGSVRVDDHGELIIPPLAADPVPPDAQQLRDDLERLLPDVQFASLLVEIDTRTAMLDRLVHAGGKVARPAELKRNLVYVLSPRPPTWGSQRWPAPAQCPTTRSPGPRSGT